MRLGFLERCLHTKSSKATDERFADVLVDAQDTLLRSNHHDAVGQFIRVQDSPATGRSADDIDPRIFAVLQVNFIDRLMPSKGNSRRCPTCTRGP